MKQMVLILIFVSLFLSSCNKPVKNESVQKDKIETIKKENKMKTIQLTKSDFLSKVVNFEENPNEWKYLGDKPALIDFYADWCGPCKAIAPVLEELASEYGEDIYIYKIDTEREGELAALFGIRSIPSLLFIPMEGKPQMSQGALPKNQLKQAIDEVLLKK